MGSTTFSSMQVRRKTVKGNDNLDEKDVAALDKDLSDEQRREWNAIYALSLIHI